MVSNICLFGLNNKYVKQIAKLISSKLEMFYADVLELLNFDFINLAEAETLVGKEYILKQEQNKIKTVSTYENTIITIDYKALNDDNNFKYLHDGAILVYLKMSKTILNKLGYTYDDEKLIDNNLQPVREEILLNKSDIIIDVKNLEENLLVNKILDKIEEYYEHR